MNLKIFKENYTGPIFLKRVFSHMNAVSRCLNNTRGIGGVRVTPNEFGGLDISADGSGDFDLSKFAFGWGAPNANFEIADNQVWIAEGYVEGRYGYHRVPGAVVNVGGNAQSKTIIIVTGDQNGAVIEQNSVAENAFTGDTSHTFQRALYRVYLRDGKVVLDQVMAGVGGIVV